MTRTLLLGALGLVLAVATGLSVHLLTRETIALPVVKLDQDAGLAPTVQQTAVTTRARATTAKTTTAPRTASAATTTQAGATTDDGASTESSTETEDNSGSGSDGSGRGRGRGRGGRDEADD